MIRTIVAMGLALAVAPHVSAKPAGEDMSAAYKAAGFRLQKGQWRKCDDPGTASYTAGELEKVGDLNGDGFPEAVVTEGSAYCYGNTGTAFSLVSKSKQGWHLVTEQEGVATFLKTKGAGGWPNLEVGGPDFCFPVYRWNGKQYVMRGHQYQGKPCKG